MRIENYLNWDDTLNTLIEQLRINSGKFENIFGSDSLIVLRDWKGRIHLCLPCDESALVKSQLTPAINEINLTLGPLSSAYNEEQDVDIDNFVIFRGNLFDPEDIWDAPNLVPLYKSEELSICLLDRQDKDSDWLKQAPSAPHQSIPRTVFFGIKGGVGRSSALTALALKLANQGKQVLVIDADFESPGISSSMLALNARPDYGIVDWLAAQALDLEDAELDNLALRQLVEPSPLSSLTSGKILVAPAHGIRTQAYVSKLARMYRITNEGKTFAQRLSDLVSRLERLHGVDVTLIDSRAGIDDTAATVITQLNAQVTFMFAINTQQTWDAYALLFNHLQRHPSLHTEDDFRSGLRLVSALTPEEASFKGYWASFREAAYQTCASGLYDAVDAKVENEESNGPEHNLEKFNFAFDDEDAPHFPMRIMWDEVLRAFDPVREPTQLAPSVMSKVFDDFLMRAERLLS